MTVSYKCFSVIEIVLSDQETQYILYDARINKIDDRARIKEERKISEKNQFIIFNLEQTTKLLNGIHEVTWSRTNNTINHRKLNECYIVTLILYTLNAAYRIITKNYFCCLAFVTFSYIVSYWCIPRRSTWWNLLSIVFDCNTIYRDEKYLMFTSINIFIFTITLNRENIMLITYPIHQISSEKKYTFKNIYTVLFIFVAINITESEGAQVIVMFFCLISLFYFYF